MIRRQENLTQLSPLINQTTLSESSDGTKRMIGGEWEKIYMKQKVVCVSDISCRKINHKGMFGFLFFKIVLENGF